MKSLLICLSICGLIFIPQYSLKAESNQNNIYVVLGGGAGPFLGRHSSNTFEAYGGTQITIDESTFEVKLGYTQFSNLANFDGVSDLFVESHAAFIRGNYFLNPYIYAGAQFGISFNNVDRSSRKRYSENSHRDPPKYSTGKQFGAHLGFELPLLSFFSLRLQSQLGLNNYKMATGSIYYSNTSTPTREDYTEFSILNVYAYFSASLVFFINT